MDINDFRREFFVVTCNMQKLMHDTVAPVCLQHGVTLQQMHVLLELVGTPGQTSTS